MNDFTIKMLTYVLPLIVAIVLHEISHGVTAYALGDDTAKRMGRFKLHTHFDLWGSFLIPIGLYLIKSPILVGYAKPVPINPYNFKKPWLDMAIVAIAGPLCNAILAVLGALFLKNFLLNAPVLIQQIMVNFIATNLVLLFFNMIPIPPLDGSRIIAALLPQKFRMTYYRLEPFGFILVIGLELLSSKIFDFIGIHGGSLFNLLIGVPVHRSLDLLLFN